MFQQTIKAIWHSPAWQKVLDVKRSHEKSFNNLDLDPHSLECPKSVLKMTVISCLRRKKIMLVISILCMLVMISLVASLYPYFSPQSRSLICSFGEGRLGNQMSAFATLFSFSSLYKYQHVMLRAQYDLLNYYFEPKIPIRARILEDSCTDFNNHNSTCKSLEWELPWPKLWLKNDTFFDHTPVEHPSYWFGRALNIGDYPNQIKYYFDFLPTLRKIFNFNSKFQDKAQINLNRAARQALHEVGYIKDPVFVGMHIRRTDIIHHLEFLYGVQMPELSYYTKAMDFFRTKYKNSAIFVVVSDDLAWTKQYLASQDVVFLGHDTVTEKDDTKPFTYADDIGEDLALLAACNHTIITFGTFGLWGAMLADGEVVLPQQFLQVKEGYDLQQAGIPEK